MNVSLDLGWWMVPLAINVAVYAVAIAKIPPAEPKGYFPDFGPAIIGFINLTCATIASLVAWLTWAVLT